jgi:UDP-N-acetylglucosamine transferase subunit ALG13
MILVTVGTQLAFDRMVRAVDDWAGVHGDVRVFAQIGPSDYRPKHIAFERFLSPEEFAVNVRACRAMVAHAGTGSIFTALESRKPILVMPRRAELGEHRNDHQLTTAAKFRQIPGIHVADTAADLAALLDRLPELDTPSEGFCLHARPELLGAVSDFVNGLAPVRSRSMLRTALARWRRRPEAK